MTTSRRWSVPPVVDHRNLVTGRMLAEHQGESRLVCELDSHPGLLYKEYKAALTADGAARLDRLVAFPDRLGQAEQNLLHSSTSWPASRVVRGAGSWGVLLPVAPPAYAATIQLVGGKTSTKSLTLDQLALTAEVQQSRGLRPPSLPERVAVCVSLTQVAALFERHGLVYLDWSLSNAFWSQDEHTAFVIDIDGCTFGPRPMIDTHGFQDPLTPRGADGGAPVDHYRVALLVARCLTGVRTDTSAQHAVEALIALAVDHPELGLVSRHVTAAVRAARAVDRPPVIRLARALARAVQDPRSGPSTHTAGHNGRQPAGRGAGPGEGGVTRWRSIGGATVAAEASRSGGAITPHREDDPQVAAAPYIRISSSTSTSNPAASSSWNETGGAAVVMVLLALAVVVFLVVII